MAYLAIAILDTTQRRVITWTISTHHEGEKNSGDDVCRKTQQTLDLIVFYEDPATTFAVSTVNELKLEVCQSSLDVIYSNYP